MRTHLVIPDTQVKPGVRLDHFVWIGRFIRDLQPDVIIHLGDHWDMPSLSSYDKGKASAIGRTYESDIAAGNEALQILHDNMGGYAGPKWLLRGNHEQRIERALDSDPSQNIGYKHFNDVELGWRPVPFLKPKKLDGVIYCHYFIRGGDGKVKQSKRGAPNAKAQLARERLSCTAGHLQGLDYHRHVSSSGVQHGLIAGSCYLHKEDYLTPQGNDHWHGVVVKSDVRRGDYSPKFYTLRELRQMYG